MTTLPMPTPAELEAEAVELLKLAEKKERMASAFATDGRLALYADAAIFRSEAASKRAKAERLRKAVTP